MIKLFSIVALQYLMMSISFASEGKTFYCEIDEETGEVIDKIGAKQHAIKLLKSKNVEDQKFGAHIITQISPLEPNSGFFFQDITLLINSDEPAVYQIGIEAIKKYIEDNAANYRPEMYTWIERYPCEPGKTATKWIKLLEDIGDDMTVYPVARQHIAKNLNYLAVVFQEMEDKKNN